MFTLSLNNATQCLHDSGVYVCVRVDALADYYPLTLYKSFDVELDPLHLSVFIREALPGLDVDNIMGNLFDLGVMAIA